MSDILSTMKKMMADYWWAPPSLLIVDRPELCYCTDPSGDFNLVARIDADDERLPELIREFSAAHKGRNSKCVTYPDQPPRLFELLSKEGYEPFHSHDARYKKPAKHQLTQQKRFDVGIVRTEDQLRRLDRVKALAFGVAEKSQDPDSLRHLLKEYNSPKPRAAQFLATDRETGQDVGSGGMGLFDDLGAAFFFAGGTIPEARNQGVYGAMIDARMSYARQRGIGIVGIFARQSSSSPIVARHGFIKCGEMTYWKRDSKNQ